MHNASFALGTWKRVALKGGQHAVQDLPFKFVFTILCSFLSELILKNILQ